MAVAPPLPSALRWVTFIGLPLIVALMVFGPLISTAQFPQACLKQAQVQWPDVELVADSLRQQKDTVVLSVRQAGGADPIQLTCTVTTYGFSRGSTSPTVTVTKSAN